MPVADFSKQTQEWALRVRDSSHFGGDTGATPQWPVLEAVSKSAVFTALNQATANCTKPYAKGKVSYELLSKLKPALVEAACPRAKTLLDKLRNL